jgi:hypothetical protein
VMVSYAVIFALTEQTVTKFNLFCQLKQKLKIFFRTKAK